MVGAGKVIRVGGFNLSTLSSSILGIRQGGLDTLMKPLFSNGEQGFAYDPNDLSTLYQDAAGTIPVTATGQPVGLVLDKSKGLVLGGELFNDATVTLNSAGGDIVTRLSAGLYRFVTTSNLIYLGLPSIGQAQDRYLLIDYEIVRLASGDLRFDNGGGRQVMIPSVVGRRTMRLMATTLTIARRTAPLDCDIRIYSIREIKGNHAYQTVSASRPILQQTPILGDELVVNADFSNGTVGWTPNGATLNNISGELEIVSVAGSPSARQVLNTQVGKTYAVSFNLRRGTTPNHNLFRVGTTSGGLDVLSMAELTASGKYTASFIATTTTSHLSFGYGEASAGQTSYWDNISIKEITGYRTDQNYLAFDGVDDFLQTNNIDFTATDKVSLFAGVRKLSTVDGMVCELGTNAATNNGSFYLAAPAGQTDKNQIAFVNRGTIFTPIQNPNLPPPISVVVSCKGDIVADNTTIRTNGTQFSSAADLGTGKYGNYPLYIGRRGGTLLPFNGHLYSLIGIGRLTTDSETITLEKAIAKNTGVTLNV